MDKQEKISELFRVAREQEPKTSFDQTKDQFLNSLKQQTVKTKDGQVFTLKKWIIMLSSILVIIGLSVLFTNSEQEIIPHKSTVNNAVGTESKYGIEKPNEENNNINSDEKIAKKLQVETINEDLVVNQKINIKKTKPTDLEVFYMDLKSHKFQAIPFDDTIKSIPIVFPKFSEKEKKAIAKQKNEMLKAVVKVDNNKKYSYLSAGNITIEEKEVSVQAFFIQSTEVTNLEYRTFLYDLLIQERRDEYLEALPNESMWVEICGTGTKPMEELYFKHPAYDDYPMVNISKKAAESYCNWLSEEVIKKYPEKYTTFKLKARIPTRVEWVYAASSKGKHMIYPWGTDSTRNSEGKYLCNYKPFPDRYFDDGGFHTVKVKFIYEPSPHGLYHMSGNVAELVYNIDLSAPKPWKPDGIGTAGGGWMDDAESIKILGKDNHPGIVDPHPNVGFRIVFTHLGR